MLHNQHVLALSYADNLLLDAGVKVARVNIGDQTNTVPLSECAEDCVKATYGADFCEWVLKI